MRRILLIAGLWAVTVTAYSQGFQLNLQGTKQIGMGQHITGAALDPSIVFYNPGGMGFTSRGVIASTSPVRLNVQAQQAGGKVDKNKPAIETPVHLYYSRSLKQASKWALGFGIYTPFGSAIKYDDNWSGKYLIQNISLVSVAFQPTVSYKITDKLGIGVGYVGTYGTVTLQRAVDLQGASGTSSATLNGAGFGHGFNAGLFYQPMKSLSIGASYRSGIKVSVKDGSAKFDVPAALSTPGANGNAAIPVDNQFNSSLPLPDVMSIGIGYRPNGKWLFIADISQVGWSSYKELRFDYKLNSTNTPGNQVANTVAARNYKNVMAYRLGAQYSIDSVWTVRAGYTLGYTPIQNGFVNPDVPDADRMNYSCGASVNLSRRIYVDAAFIYEDLAKRTGTYSAENFTRNYANNAFVGSLSIGYNF